MTRYKITVEYNGTTLIGWQKNKDGMSAQELLEKAVFDFCGQVTDVYSAGRTDAGVHARAMVAHFDIDVGDKDYSGDTIVKALNFYLQKKPISILAAEIVDDEFHSRFSCIGRSYQYRILNRKTPTVLDKDFVWWYPRTLDIDKMKAQAEKFIGHHDFTSFRSSDCQAKSPHKTLDKLEIIQNGDYIEINVAAKSFLHHMVRNIVGTLVEIGVGRDMDVSDILKAKSRCAAGITAPASGLYFMNAFYE